jgi:hypothetical protein
MPGIHERKKFRKLAEMEGFESVTALIEHACIDSMAPAICCNPEVPDCDYTESMEPDQDRDWCEACQAGTMKSCLVLAGVI